MPLHWATTENLIAANPGVPLEALRVLALDDDEEVRTRVAQDPNSTASVSEDLRADSGARARLLVAELSEVGPGAVETPCADERPRRPRRRLSRSRPRRCR